MNIQRVASRCDNTREYIKNSFLNKVDRKWLLISNVRSDYEYVLKHGKRANIDRFDAVWVDEWPALYANEQFLFDLFSMERLIIFSQKYEFPLDDLFFTKWSKTYEYLIKDKLAPCMFSSFKNIICEYSYSHPYRVHSLQDFSINSMQYLDQESLDGPSAFFSKELSIASVVWSSFYLWLNGRHHPREVLISIRENKNRRNPDQENALSGQACHWRTFVAFWKNGFSTILWWSRRWEKTKEFHIGAWIPHWNRTGPK